MVSRVDFWLNWRWQYTSMYRPWFRVTEQSLIWYTAKPATPLILQRHLLHLVLIRWPKSLVDVNVSLSHIKRGRLSCLKIQTSIILHKNWHRRNSRIERIHNSVGHASLQKGFWLDFRPSVVQDYSTKQWEILHAHEETLKKHPLNSIRPLSLSCPRKPQLNS